MLYGWERNEDGSDIWQSMYRDSGHVCENGVCIHCGGLAGDQTEDGNYDAMDLICFIKRLLGDWSDDAMWITSDVNGDGATDVLDVIRLVQNIADAV